MAKEAKTGLVKDGSAKFGKALIEQAQDANRKFLTDRVVGDVQTILLSIDKQIRYKEQTEKNLEILRARLAAIEKGQFKLSTYGTMSYDDPELEKAIIAMAECVNCGCNLSKHGRQ